MATKKRRPGRPPKELRERLPSMMRGPAEEAAVLVNAALGGATLDERAESLIALVAVLRRAEGGEALDVDFYATIQAVLHHSEAAEMLGLAGKALLKRKQ